MTKIMYKFKWEDDSNLRTKQEMDDEINRRIYSDENEEGSYYDDIMELMNELFEDPDGKDYDEMFDYCSQVLIGDIWKNDIQVVVK